MAGFSTNSFWTFIRSKSNRDRLAWLGGGSVVVIAGIWAAIVYFFPPQPGPGRDRTQINASCGSVAISGKVSGTKIVVSGPTNSNCAIKPN